jgi:hypothetical protein
LLSPHSTHSAPLRKIFVESFCAVTAKPRNETYE